MRLLRHLSDATRSRSLEVFECDRDTVEHRRLPDRAVWTDMASGRKAMDVTGWRLAHAVVMADFLVSGDYGFASLSFLFQMHRILSFGSAGNLRLFAGASRKLNDVTQSSVVGRVGQGLSILFAHSQGYRFVCHLAQLPEVVSWLAKHPKDKERRVADFLFEGEASARMILESKATFTLERNDPVIVKAPLKAALMKQVSPWMTRVTPNATKGFACFSAVREIGGEPSMVAFVDPAGDGETGEGVPRRSDVRRWNYAAWLSAMGLRPAAERLRRRPSEDMGTPQTVAFFVAVAAGTKFAVIIEYDHGVPMPGDPQDELGMLHVIKSLAADPQREFVAIGIHAQAMRAIEEALGGDDQQLLAYDFEIGEAGDEQRPRSIFPDGTFFGVVRAKDIGAVATFLL